MSLCRNIPLAALVLLAFAIGADAEDVVRGTVAEVNAPTAVVTITGGKQAEPGDFVLVPIPNTDAMRAYYVATGVVTEASPGRAVIRFRPAVEGGSLKPGAAVEIFRLTDKPAGHDEPPADGMVLIAPDLVVAKGSQVLVPVRLLRGRDVLNMDFELSYQPEIAAALPDPQRGSLITEISQNNLAQPGLFKFNFAQLSPINGDGSVAGFRFNATGPGRSRTPLTLNVHTVNSSQGTRLPIRVINGSITIYDPGDLGDPKNPHGTSPTGGPPDPGGQGGLGGPEPHAQPTCSGSGRQTVADAQCCLKMWVGLTPRGLFMDLDRNNEVDSRDAVVVLQNVAQGLSR